jgi:hypothetical protein
MMEWRSVSSSNTGGKLSSGPFTRRRSKEGAAIGILGLSKCFWLSIKVLEVRWFFMLSLVRSKSAIPGLHPFRGLCETMSLLRLRSRSTYPRHYSTRACTLQPTDLLACYKALVLRGKLHQDEDQLRAILQLKRMAIPYVFEVV